MNRFKNICSHQWKFFKINLNSHSKILQFEFYATQIASTLIERRKVQLLAAPAGRTQQVFETRQGK